MDSFDHAPRQAILDEAIALLDEVRKINALREENEALRGGLAAAGLVHSAKPKKSNRTKAANRKRMAAAAMEVISGTNTGKPIGKVSQIEIHSLKIKDLIMRLATPAGLEPATCRLEGG